MKKTLLLTLALIFSIVICAQNKGTLVSESFDSAEMPEGWKITGGQNKNWSVSESNFCGGNAYEMKLDYTPVFYNGFTRLTSPTLDLTGIDSLMVSFRHYVDIYTTYPSTIGIATSSNNGASWNVCYEETFYIDGLHHITKVISNDDIGKEKVMVAIFFRGNSANINAVYFDDVEIMTIEAINAKVNSIDLPNNTSSGDFDLTFSVQNLGVEKITSFEAEYDVNGETYSQTFTTDMASFEAKQFTFEQKASLLPGVSNVTVNVKSVNGKDDDDKTNNILTKEINVALNTAQRFPMIEHFSSSTCGYCVEVDNLMNSLASNNTGKFTYVKYPLNFPSPGDPYNTEECNIKKNYYGVNAAPRVAFNGFNIGATAVSQYLFDESYNTPAFVDIKGAFDVNEKTINITADIISYINLKNVNVFVAVNEKTTTGNVSTNGETEFHHVMMKMFPDANGSSTNFKIGETQRFEFTHDLSGTFVEETNDLEVAVWVQDLVSGEVFNSAFIYEYTEHPYPVQNLTLTEADDEIQVTWEKPEKGNPKAYNLYFNNELVLDNTTELSYSTAKTEDFYKVEVVALYDNKTSVGVIKSSLKETDTTGIISNYESSFEIYPNPAANNLTISTNENIKEVNIYNILGVNVYSDDAFSGGNIDVSKFRKGGYFIQVKTDNSKTIRRFVKK